MKKTLTIILIFTTFTLLLFSFPLIHASGCFKWDTILSPDYTKYTDDVSNIFIEILETESIKPICMEWKGRMPYPLDDDFVIPCSYDEDCPGEGKFIYSLVEEGTSGFSDIEVWSKDGYKIFLCEEGKCEEKLLMTNVCQNNKECEKISTLKGNEGKTICDKSKIPYMCVLSNENKSNNNQISFNPIITTLIIVSLVLIILVVFLLVKLKSKKRD